jgi:hypothetical protein
MMKVITVKDLKEKLQRIPDDAIVCCQSDSEGNSTSTCLDVEIDQVGYKHTMEGYDFTFIGGEDIEGIDMEKDKGKYLVIMQPSL